MRRQTLGYFLPKKGLGGADNIAIALLGFESLAHYERYRARLSDDPDSRANLWSAYALDQAVLPTTLYPVGMRQVEYVDPAGGGRPLDYMLIYPAAPQAVAMSQGYNV